LIVDTRQKKAEELSAKGFECLKSAEYKKALKIAAQLEKIRFSACFEIAAQAHAGLGDVEKAVRVLERGIELAPDVWLNWQLLGNYLSDLDRFEEAEQAYQKALSCANASTSYIRLNQAILANRQNKFNDALLLLGKIDEKELGLEKSEACFYSLVGLNRIDEAINLADRILKETSEEDGDLELFGRVAATLGRLRLKQGETKEEVRKWSVGALKIYEHSDRLLALIRDIDELYSETAKYYRLQIHGIIPPTSPRYSWAKGFYTTCDVVADNAEEALSFIREFEDEDLQGNLFIEEENIIEPRPNDPKGVYWHAGYTFYEREN
jgi:tetratricopeptide (TPR) repeat protein